jgi:hypothetical protein
MPFLSPVPDGLEFPHQQICIEKKEDEPDFDRRSCASSFHAALASLLRENSALAVRAERARFSNPPCIAQFSRDSNHRADLLPQVKAHQRRWPATLVTVAGICQAQSSKLERRVETTEA